MSRKWSGLPSPFPPKSGRSLREEKFSKNGKRRAFGRRGKGRDNDKLVPRRLLAEARKCAGGGGW